MTDSFRKMIVLVDMHAKFYIMKSYSGVNLYLFI